ncbi:hypothetical protein GCM10009594_10630 [Kocuria palustris]
MHNYAGRSLAKAPGTSPDSTLDKNHQRISLVIETELHHVSDTANLTDFTPFNTPSGRLAHTATRSCPIGHCPEWSDEGSDQLF